MFSMLAISNLKGVINYQNFLMGMNEVPSLQLKSNESIMPPDGISCLKSSNELSLMFNDFE